MQMSACGFIERVQEQLQFALRALTRGTRVQRWKYRPCCCAPLADRGF